jgi:hypothetical protein
VKDVAQMTNPSAMDDDELRAEIAALEPKVREFEKYHRRRWELLQELGLRNRRTAADEAMAQRPARRM